LLGHSEQEHHLWIHIVNATSCWRAVTMAWYYIVRVAAWQG
jgi:hypothetical protein